MTTSNTTTDPDEFTERRTLRDHWEALKAALGRGEDVDPLDLADARIRAEAEQETETARMTRHQRKREQAAQDAAAARADELAKGIDADFRAASEARIDAAWTAYLEVIEAEVETARAHNAEVSELAREVRAAGVPVIRGSSRAQEGDHVSASVGDWNRQIPTWRGTLFPLFDVAAERLPHLTDKSQRRQRIEQLRGRMT